MPQVLSMKNERVWKERIDVVRIDRSTPWGNPFIIGINGNRDTVCDGYLEWLNVWIEYNKEITYQIGIRTFSNKWIVENLHLLKGKDVACWCSPERCHGDTLIKLANL